MQWREDGQQELNLPLEGVPPTGNASGDGHGIAMPTAPVGDKRVAIFEIDLLALGMRAEAARRICRTLILTQVRTYRATGHIIDLSTRAIRSQIQRATQRGVMRPLFTRCIRCGQQAPLMDWVAAIDWAPDPLVPGIIFLGNPLQPVDFNYLAACTGDDLYRDAITLLE